MVLSFSVGCEIPVSPSTFWRMRADPDFLDHLVHAKALRRVTYSPVTAAEGADPNGPEYKTRTLVYVPYNDIIPDMALSLVGDSAFELQDRQTWTEHAQGEHGKHALSFAVTNTSDMLKGLVTTDGTLRLEHTDEGKEAAMHYLDVEVTVNVFGIGGYLESAIQDNMNIFYAEYPNVVKSFKEKVEQYMGSQPEGCCFDDVYRKYEDKRQTESVKEGGECGDNVKTAGDGAIQAALASTKA